MYFLSLTELGIVSQKIRGDEALVRSRIIDAVQGASLKKFVGMVVIQFAD